MQFTDILLGSSLEADHRPQSQTVHAQQAIPDDIHLRDPFVHDSESTLAQSTPAQTTSTHSSQNFLEYSPLHEQSPPSPFEQTSRGHSPFFAQSIPGHSSLFGQFTPEHSLLFGHTSTRLDEDPTSGLFGHPTRGPLWQNTPEYFGQTIPGQSPLFR